MDRQMRLTDEEISQVVQRAHEIHELQTRVRSAETNLDEYVKIAEEMDVPREAMMQALKERYAFLDREATVGQIVFARSGDQHFYPAKVKSVSGNSVDVHFFNGGDSSIGLHDLQEAQFSPGTQYDYYSPMNMCYVRGRVARYDRDGLAVTFNIWGIEETVPLAKVRVRKESNKVPATLQGWMLALAALLAGGTIATLITWLVLR